MKRIIFLLIAISLIAIPVSASTYIFESKYENSIPFKSAMYYNPILKQWNYIEIKNATTPGYTNLITMPGNITNPETYFYPTVAQMNQINAIQKAADKGKLTLGSKIHIVRLYYSITQSNHPPSLDNKIGPVSKFINSLKLFRMTI